MRRLRRLAALGGLLALLGLAPAHASILVTVTQSGADVVATATGSLDTDAFGQPTGPLFTTARIAPSQGFLLVGDSGTPSAPLSHLLFFASNSSVTAFGTGGVREADSATGDLLGIFINSGSDAFFIVPQGYVSEAALSGSATWFDTDLAGLGLQPGSFNWAAFTDTGVQELTLVIEAAVPVPAPGGMLLFAMALGGLGLARLRAA